MTKAIVLLLLCYFGLVVMAYLFQGRLLYQPGRRISMTPEDIGLPYEEVPLLTSDGVHLSAWYVPSERERGVVLFCHGNAGNMSHRLDSINIFHELRLSVMIFDYRGYGRSAGAASEEGTYRDAEAALIYLTRDRGVGPASIIVFGRSLGGAVAAHVALNHAAAALIVESSFTSVPDLGAELYPFLPVRLISRFRYPTAAFVERIGIPKLFIHSPDDEVIPFRHGERLLAFGAEPKEFLRIQGGHNDGFLVSGRLYREGLDSFIGRVLRSE